MNDNNPVPSPRPESAPPFPSDPTLAPPVIPVDVMLQRSAPTASFSQVARDCLACNPFFLLSAALLLYSFYRVSADPNFLGGELPKLFFNLGSLQLYEGMLVVTAIFLAGRAVWYDSTLLVGLENLLLLVPFILISQAALIDTRLVWICCAAAGCLAAIRLGLLKRLIPQLNAPPRLLAVGLLILAANTVLPAVYRLLHESKSRHQTRLGCGL